MGHDTQMCKWEDNIR